MKTRQELILDFMLALASTDRAGESVAEDTTEDQKTFARDAYLMAAIFADQYLSEI